MSRSERTHDGTGPTETDTCECDGDFPCAPCYISGRRGFPAVTEVQG